MNSQTNLALGLEPNVSSDINSGPFDYSAMTMKWDLFHHGTWKLRGRAGGTRRKRGSKSPRGLGESLVCSDRRASKSQVVAKANRSKAPKSNASLESECEGISEAPRPWLWLAEMLSAENGIDPFSPQARTSSLHLIKSSSG